MTTRRSRLIGRMIAAGATAFTCLAVAAPTASAAPPDQATAFREALERLDAGERSAAAPPSARSTDRVATDTWWHPPVRPVRDVDLERYLGTWLQLATIPSFISAGCARDTQAEYALLANGEVDVTNTCVGRDGQPVVADGQARVVGPRPSQLEVTFAFTPDGQPIYEAAGDYWIIGLDQRDYEWAVVGAPDRESLFVLSRDPLLSPRQVFGVLRSILRSGYDPCRIVLTATTGGIEQDVPLCG